jgi:uncharacterized membrane protein
MKNVCVAFYFRIQKKECWLGINELNVTLYLMQTWSLPAEYFMLLGDIWPIHSHVFQSGIPGQCP